MKTTRLLHAFLLSLALGLALVGCADDCDDIDCYPCGPAVTFHIVEAGTSAVITDATITNSQNELLVMGCPSGGSDAGVGPCTLGVHRDAGTVSFRISAPGHGTVTTTVEIPPAADGCCACASVAAPVEIALPRL